MSSANYIPLSQISSSEYLAPPRITPHTSFISYLSRRRAVLALIGATSVLTLVLFLRVFGDDFELADIPVNPDYQSSYISIQVPNSLPASAHPKLRPVYDLPLDCLDRYYSLGDVCHDGQGPGHLDVIWTWVNGSDPLFADAREQAAESYAKDDPYRPADTNNPSRMYRDHDELRHSLRSVLANFRPYTRRFRILTSDIDYPAEDPDESMQSFPDPGPGYWRLGLQPQWLDTHKTVPQWQDGEIQLSLNHHAHFFEPYKHTIFNSYAIESQFSHLQDMSEVFLYMNDDFYMTAPLTPVTFYTNEYGLVLRVDNDMTVPPDWPDKEAKGEWRSMGVSNWLLSKRFGQRPRPYVQHETKSVSFAILQEVALVWPDAIAKTGTHAFRETEGGDGDFYAMFMFTHYVVERSREALLWTWVVGRIGTIDDSWGEHEADRAWLQLGGEWDGKASKEIQVESGFRDTLAADRIRDHLKDGGFGDGPFKTEYRFSSLDGYAYNQYGTRGFGWLPGYDPKKFEQDDPEKDNRKCTILRDECFGFGDPTSGLQTASAVFKHIAFDRPHCGDCIIVALLNASGRLGLSAFLPHPDRRSPPSDSPPPTDESSSSTIPHLPVVDDWHDGHFALRDVMKYAPDASVREWSLRIMQRYRYVIGYTPSSFERLLNKVQVLNMLAYLDQHEEIALLCVNDDVEEDEAQISRYFRRWQDRRWSRAAAWESDVRH